MVSYRERARERFLEWLRPFNKRVTNRITMSFAGERVFAVVHHEGRQTRRAYATPVVAMPTEDGFVIPLTYGEHVDWCRNLIAAGGGRIQWKGRTYVLVDPRIVDPPAALPYLPRWLRPLLSRTHRYLRLRVA